MSNAAHKISDDIHSHEGGTITIDGPRGMTFYRLKTLLSAMDLEVRTGMMMTSRAKANPFAVARQVLGVKTRAKAKLLDQLKAEWIKRGDEGMVDLAQQNGW